MYVDTLLTQEKGVTLLRIRIILITFVLRIILIRNNVTPFSCVRSE